MFSKHKKIQHAAVKSEPYQPTLFKKGQCNQVTNVNVAVNERDDDTARCLSGCFSACFGIGKKAAMA